MNNDPTEVLTQEWTPEVMKVPLSAEEFRQILIQLEAAAGVVSDVTAELERRENLDSDEATAVKHAIASVDSIHELSVAVLRLCIRKHGSETANET